MDMLNMAWRVVATDGDGTIARRRWLRRWAAVAAASVLLALLAWQAVVHGPGRADEPQRAAVAALAGDHAPCLALADSGLLEACLLRARAGRPGPGQRVAGAR